MSVLTEQLAATLAEAYAEAHTALTKLEAKAKAYKQELAADGSPIPPVTWAKIRGLIAGAGARVADSHLAITPYDVRPTPMDGGGGK